MIWFKNFVLASIFQCQHFCASCHGDFLPVCVSVILVITVSFRCVLYPVCAPVEMDECNFHGCRNHFVTKGCTHIVYGCTLCFRLYFRLEADYITPLHMSVYIPLNQHAWRSNVICGNAFSNDPTSKHVSGEHSTDLWPHNATQPNVATP